jgi:hypothetical protein
VIPSGSYRLRSRLAWPSFRASASLDLSKNISTRGSRNCRSLHFGRDDKGEGSAFSGHWLVAGGTAGPSAALPRISYTPALDKANFDLATLPNKSFVSRRWPRWPTNLFGHLALVTSHEPAAGALLAICNLLAASTLICGEIAVQRPMQKIVTVPGD